MTEKENPLADYLNYPYDRFLKLRVEFLILTQNEVEAKMMRIIEWCVENEREHQYRNKMANTPKGQSITLSETTMVQISHRFFMNWLHGTVQSETTIKEALRSLEAKHLIFKRPGPGIYDAPFYMLNKPLIMHLFSLLPRDITAIDMEAIMKQPRKKKTKDGTKIERGAIIDPIVQQLKEAIIAPENRQLLPPPPQFLSPWDEIFALRGEQKLPPKRYRKERLQKKREEVATSVPTPQGFSQQEETAATTLMSKNLKEISLEELVSLKSRIDALLEEKQPSLHEQTSDLLEKLQSAVASSSSKQVNDEQQCTDNGQDVQRDVPTFMHGSASFAVETPSETQVQDIHTQGETWRPEEYVQVIEQLRGQRYAVDLRTKELRAAAVLMQQISPFTGAPVTPEEVAQAWSHTSDTHWRSTHGGDNMHVHDFTYHTSHGNRWIEASLEHLRGTREAFGHDCEQRKSSGYRQPQVSMTTDDSGPVSGNKVARHSEPPVRMVEWKGRSIPEEQAYQEGYYGGFERFLPGDHPDDDLEALVKRYQAEGILPILVEVKESVGV